MLLFVLLSMLAFAARRTLAATLALGRALLSKETAADSTGQDLFFRYDVGTGWREVVLGDEEGAASRREDPPWTEDHERLALQLARSEDYRAAATEFAKLSTAHSRNPTYARMAALCFEGAEEDSAAAEWSARAAALRGAGEQGTGTGSPSSSPTAR